MPETVPNFASRYERMFYQGLRIRLVEERIIALYPSDRIQSPVHLSIGQEAVAVGLCDPLRSDDLLFGTYRSHAFYIAKGGCLKEMFAELSGKLDGMAKGKAGSMHLTAPTVGFMGSSAVVASAIPHAVGAALAARNRGTDQVIVTAFGDGSTEEGVYHESLNFAALQQLPVLFVCENNGLAVHASLRERQAYSTLEQARLYGIDARHLAEGWDFERVRETAAEMVDAIRSDRRPRFLEIQTFRYKEHVGPGDDFDAGYRPRAAMEEWQRNDALIHDRALVEKFTPVIEAEIDEAVAFAEASPAPGLDELLTDVL